MSDRTLGLVVAMGVCLSSVASGQCVPPANSHEAKLLAFYEVPIAFAMADAPRVLPLGGVTLTGELVGVPAPSAVLNSPNYCYSGSQDGSHLAPVLPRLRVAVGLPAGFAAEATYVPPVAVDQATPSLGSAALSYTRLLTPVAGAVGPVVIMQLRAHGTIGSVKGPITCPASALQQTDVNEACYGSTPSHDTYYPNSTGVEAALAAATPGQRVSVYGGAGYTWLTPRFRVGFMDGSGVTDRTLVVVDLQRVPLMAGVGVQLLRNLDAGAQVYAVTQDITTWRLTARYRL